MSRVLTIEDFSYTGTPEPTTIPKAHLLTSKQATRRNSPKTIGLFSPELPTPFPHQPTQQPTSNANLKETKGIKKDNLTNGSENKVVKKASLKKNESTGGSYTPMNEKSDQIIKLYGPSFFNGKPGNSNSPAFRLRKTNTNGGEKSPKIEPKIILQENPPQEKCKTETVSLSLSPFSRTYRQTPQKQEAIGSQSPQSKFLNFRQLTNKVSYNDYVTSNRDISKQQSRQKEELRLDSSPGTVKSPMPQEWSLTTVDLGEGIKKKETRSNFDDKAIEVMNRESKNIPQTKKAGPKSFNQSPLNMNTPRELPPLNLSKVPEKNRAYSFTKPSLQGLSSRVFRADTEEGNDGEHQGLSERMKLLNFISVQNTQRAEKNTIDSIERSLRNGANEDKNETHLSSESNEALAFLQKLRESDVIKDKKGPVEKKVSDNTPKKKDIKIETKIRVPTGTVRSPKKTMTFTEGNSPSGSDQVKFRKSFQVSHRHKGSANMGNDLQEDYVTYKKAASDPKNGSVPFHKAELIKGKTSSFKQELTQEERYEKIMKSNIQDKFNEIFRSLRSKKKVKKVQFSCDFVE